jgi:hypothetical protein
LYTQFGSDRFRKAQAVTGKIITRPVKFVGKTPKWVKEAGMQYGYGNRKPGKYSMGGGIVLIVGNTGKSSWYGRVVVDGKETTKKLAVANQQCNLDRAKGLLLDMREQARNGVLTRRTQANAVRIATSQVRSLRDGPAFKIGVSAITPKLSSERRTPLALCG